MFLKDLFETRKKNQKLKSLQKNENKSTLKIP